MFTVDVSQLEQLEKTLISVRDRAIPFATKATINRAAFETQKAARANIKSGMTTRNQFTVRSVQVDQARTLDIRKQEAIVGSIADYMATQEFGGQTEGSGKHDMIAPTSWAAGQGMKKRPRTRLPRRANALKNIKLAGLIKLGQIQNHRQEAFLRGLLAARMGRKFVFIPGGTGATTGIFRVWGKDRVKGQFRGIKMRLAYRMQERSSTIPETPWLLPATKHVTPQLKEYYASALRFQLKRYGL